MSGSPFSLQVSFTTVQCGAIQQKVRQGKHEVLSQYLPVTLHIAILIRRQIVGVELRQNLEVFLSAFRVLHVISPLNIVLLDTTSCAHIVCGLTPRNSAASPSAIVGWVKMV